MIDLFEDDQLFLHPVVIDEPSVPNVIRAPMSKTKTQYLSTFICLIPRNSE